MTNKVQNTSGMRECADGGFFKPQNTGTRPVSGIKKRP